MKDLKIILLMLFLGICSAYPQKATVREELMEMPTYPFSDPDPVPNIGRIYPYFDFSGFTDKPLMQKWKMVILENDYIEVFVCPDIGGKIWGAKEKSTGKDFLYFNHAVKFRDVAMRGPWTSGGIEFNFGDIGHIPTCATPVDYVLKEYADGSVSCIVGAIDLPSGTKWNVEIMVHPDKAYFETEVKWFNSTSLPCTYYHWMNAAAKSAGNLEFIYPGSNWIGHDGMAGDWPVDNGREINFYEKNNFGSYKSYHVLNSYSNFFGGYYHDDNFGFGHLCDYDEKPGKKLWIWGLSQQGMIWEDLLSDNDGQYIEFQAGKLFNQAAQNSTRTPFKHKEFAPHDADVMNEIWFPVKETGGMVAASEKGILNIEDEGDRLELVFSALQTVDDQLLIRENGKIVSSIKLQLTPLEMLRMEYVPDEKSFEVALRSGERLYSSDPDDQKVERPLYALPEFNWESAYGIFTEGLELEKQRMFAEGMDKYKKVLIKDPGFMPAINRLALGYFRKMDYIKALELINRSLRIDSYDPEANYLYGLINRELGYVDESKSGFSIAAASVEYRCPAYLELSKSFFSEGDYSKALDYARKSLSFNIYNPVAHQVMALAYRKTGNAAEGKKILKRLFDLDGTNHFVRFETIMIDESENFDTGFQSYITNELPYESYLDLAIFYSDLGCIEEAVTILNLSPDYAVKDILLYRLDPGNSETYIDRVINASPKFVFPYRNITAQILEEIIQENDHWKFKYYLGLIYWSRDMDKAAYDLFDACGSSPDFSAFYLAKAKLCTDPGRKEANVLKAYETEPDDWRSAMALVDHYLSVDKAKIALPVCEKFINKNPEQSAIGLAYARTLMGMNLYEESIKFLESYTVLPFEGATVGRDLYHEACIRLAENYLEKKEYERVIEYAGRALEWPVNLGVGKPYDVDESLERSLIQQAEKGLGKKK